MEKTEKAQNEESKREEDFNQRTNSACYTKITYKSVC